MVFCFEICSDLLWEKLFVSFFRNFEVSWTIYSSSEKSEQFLVTECFFVSKRLEQLEFKLEKNYRDLEHAGKNRKLLNIY